MSSSDHTGRDWVVLLEAAAERAGATLEPTSFARMVSSWSTPAPTTLYTPDRYALQVPVRAPTPPLALSSAISLWRDALRRSGLPEWELVRTEVLTPEELEAEWQAAEGAGGDFDACPEVSPSTEEDALGDALLRDALQDSVTGLPGRELFIAEVRAALAAGESASATQAVMVVHLDALEGVEPAGQCSLADDVVAEMAGWLTELVRRADTVARSGPADLALLVHVPSVDGIDRLARRITERFGGRFLGGRQRVATTASVGVATTSCGRDADQLSAWPRWRCWPPGRRVATATDTSPPARTAPKCQRRPKPCRRGMLAVSKDTPKASTRWSKASTR